ncbi:PREDICTED: RNA-binding motif, single-stranded-interacting protein 1-like [Priapulus caudatus]|uniref:Protein alan shepard n=1 Tax=Priapulus caudatus TaxID=37621 RepID=A0ABM1F1H8_PRICU|nr:PREDICTED: RNA-binding motif, single-stranded-interacting protein 1-like [Priapulus caudatus]
MFRECSGEFRNVAGPVCSFLCLQQEQDPTNLYFANLPLFLSEKDLENRLVSYGPIVSTRILRDPNGQSRGVGFARLESKEKCEQAVAAFHGKSIQGGIEPLLVKFADGKSKKPAYNKESNRWRDDGLGYQPQYGEVHQNGLASMQLQSGGIMSRYSLAPTPVTSYPVQAGGTWMQPQAYQQVMASGMSGMDPNSASHLHGGLMPQLTAQMGQLQMSNTGSYMQSQHPYTPMQYHVPMMPVPTGTPDALQVGSWEHSSNPGDV